MNEKRNVLGNQVRGRARFLVKKTNVSMNGTCLYEVIDIVDIKYLPVRVGRRRRRY
jgi:hypothetical protein